MKKPTSAEIHTEPSAELSKQAWVWLRLFSSGDANAEDAERLRRWVRTSAAHQAAYNDAKVKWDAVKPSAGAVLHSNAKAAKYYKFAQGSVHRHRRAFLGAAVSAAAVAGVAITYPPLGLWPSPSEWSADYRTATGEQRTLALAQNVEVILNTQTSIRRQTDHGETVGLDLIGGEAAIDLKGAGRRFAVAAGAGRASAESGRFEIRYIDRKVCVTCVDGSVQVDHPAGSRTLQARQQTVYDAHSISSVASVEPADISAWRNGLLVFHQTPLASAIDEINRYRPGRVILMNKAVRNEPVSGRFSIASLDLALWQLQHVFDLHAQSMVAGVLILS